MAARPRVAYPNLFYKIVAYTNYLGYARCMSKSKKPTLLTAAAGEYLTAIVMDKLGGTDVVAKLTRREYNAAFNWRTQHTFPSKTYVILNNALLAAGYYVADPDALWAMTVAETAA